MVARLYTEQAEEFVRTGRLIGMYPKSLDKREAHKFFVYDLGNGIYGHYDPQSKICNVTTEVYTKGFK